jgi:chromate transporter
MLAILAQAVWMLGRSAWRSVPLGLLGLTCGGLALAGVHPLAVLLAAGLLAMTIHWSRARGAQLRGFTVLSAGFSAGGMGSAVGSVGMLPLLGAFLKLGVVIFGSGYVLLAFLQADLVNRLHWISSQQLLDAVTAGQLTPGPVFATATFLGFLLRGWSGAAVATLAIFLPSFAMAGMVGALAERLRSSRLAGAFLDGVNAAAVALMACVALPLGYAALVDGWTWALAVVCGVLLLRFHVNATWLILAAAGLGLLVYPAVR